ncbi:hypothetical protein FWK35_00003124, partial [Aphis craccivora]
MYTLSYQLYLMMYCGIQNLSDQPYRWDSCFYLWTFYPFQQLTLAHDLYHNFYLCQVHKISPTLHIQICIYTKK